MVSSQMGKQNSQNDSSQRKSPQQGACFPWPDLRKSEQEKLAREGAQSRRSSACFSLVGALSSDAEKGMEAKAVGHCHALWLGTQRPSVSVFDLQLAESANFQASRHAGPWLTT